MHQGGLGHPEQIRCGLVGRLNQALAIEYQITVGGEVKQILVSPLLVLHPVVQLHEVLGLALKRFLGSAQLF